MILDLATHPRRFVTVPDLVAYIHIPRATVYWHIRVGHLPIRRFGRAIRIETEEARRWTELYAYPRVSQTTGCGKNATDLDKPLSAP